ncbi:hypothetical protein AZF37_04885 [endosymbiont 'TC1' of Trimyema compressum]|uniref:hypothetical protein n=1 Tax=endosymbiont 'TC1' of Trimyema compressum TaxID=243899 RepID=UPI0007F15190|nr:hypothetical protein [endosymbiont 'TC1' of Trimyema compressum]AMP20595.1 hypothetical protein AZF37_04885 [endosymbiont 'TC1' of Trimyema compressum]
MLIKKISFFQKTNYCKGNYGAGDQITLNGYLQSSEFYLNSGAAYHKILERAEQVLLNYFIHPLMKQYFFHILYDYDSIHRDIPLFNQLRSEEKFEIILHQSYYFINSFLETEKTPSGD